MLTATAPSANENNLGNTRKVRGHLARRQFMMLVDDVQQQEDERQRQERLRKKNYEEHLPVYDRVS